MHRIEVSAELKWCLMVKLPIEAFEWRRAVLPTPNEPRSAWPVKGTDARNSIDSIVVWERLSIRPGRCQASVPIETARPFAAFVQVAASSAGFTTQVPGSREPDLL